MSILSRGDINPALISGAFQGLLPGSSVRSIFARADLGGSGEDTDLWSSAITQEVKIPISVAEPMRVVSNDADDAVGNPGLQTLFLSGLDSGFNEISEIIQLNGLTPAVTTQNFLRLNAVRAATSGSYGAEEGANLGTIVITGDTTGNLEGRINSGDGRMSNSHITVPAGHVGILQSRITFNSNMTGDNAILILGRQNNLDLTSAPYGAQLVIMESALPAGTVTYDIGHSVSVPERSDIWARLFLDDLVGFAQITYSLIIVRTGAYI